MIPSAIGKFVYNNFTSREKRYEFSGTKSIWLMFLRKWVVFEKYDGSSLKSVEGGNQHVSKILKLNNLFRLSLVSPDHLFDVLMSYFDSTFTLGKICSETC